MADSLIRTFSFIVYLVLLNFFFSSWSVETKPSSRYLLSLVALIFGVLLNSLLVPSSVQPLLNIVITIMAMLVAARHYEVPTKETVFWIVTLLAINFIYESISLATFEAFFSLPYNANDLPFAIITTSITLSLGSLTFLAIKLIFFRQRSYEALLTTPMILALTSIPIISIIVLLSFLLLRINVNVQSTFFVLLVAFGILYMNICMLYLYGSLSKHLQKMKQMMLQNKALNFELKYVAEIKKSQTQLKSLRHDLKNQYLVLLGLIEDKQLTEAKDYLTTSIQQVSSQQVFYTHDVVLNYLLNDKKQAADTASITFTISVLLGEQSNVDHDILAVLIGNLIDNAIEAASRLSNRNEADISLTIKQFDGKLLIDLNNTYDPEEKNTRRQRQYDGLGVSNIKRIVNNYNGLYRQWTEGNRYFVSIILLNVA